MSAIFFFAEYQVVTLVCSDFPGFGLVCDFLKWLCVIKGKKPPTKSKPFKGAYGHLQCWYLEPWPSMASVPRYFQYVSLFSFICTATGEKLVVQLSRKPG